MAGCSRYRKLRSQVADPPTLRPPIDQASEVGVLFLFVGQMSPADLPWQESAVDIPDPSD